MHTCPEKKISQHGTINSTVTILTMKEASISHITPPTVPRQFTSFKVCKVVTPTKPLNTWIRPPVRAVFGEDCFRDGRWADDPGEGPIRYTDQRDSWVAHLTHVDRLRVYWIGLGRWDFTVSTTSQMQSICRSGAPLSRMVSRSRNP